MFIHMHHILLNIHIVIFFPLVCDIHYVFSSCDRHIFERKKKEVKRKKEKDQLASLTLTTKE